MTLLAPTALIGLLLLIVPILIHLFKPRKMRQTPFSSLRWLKLTQQRLSRRIRWHQWLLFLLRAGLIVLLVFALARPLFDHRGQHSPTDRFIILDGGRIMSSRNGDEPSAFDEARDLAMKLAAQGRAGDRTAILLAGGPPKLLCPLTADPGEYLPRLQAASPQATEASISTALPLLTAMKNEPSSRETEVIFLTSNQRHDWQAGEIEAFTQQLGEAAGHVHVRVIETGKSMTSNAWIAGVRLLDSGASEELILRVEIGCVGDADQERSVRLTGIAQLHDDVQDVTLQPGKLARVDFRLPASLSLEGQVAEVRLEPADAVPSDDRYFLNLDLAWALRILVVEPGTEAPEDRRPSLFLRTSLEALANAGNYSFRLTTRSSANIANDDIQHADLVVLGSVPKLTEETIAALEARVRRGAGLVVFLGSNLDSPCYQQQLHKPLQPAEGLLSVQLASGADAIRRAPSSLRQIRWTHPLLAPLHDPLLGDVSQRQFRKYLTFSNVPPKSDVVLATFEDDTPALVEHALGAGRVLLWNTTLDDTWSDLPLGRCFVPLVDRTIAYLSAGGVRRQFQVGEPIQLPLVDWQAGDAVTITGPNGAAVPGRVRSDGPQALLHLEPVTEPGIYRVEQRGGQERSWLFAVNTDRAASPLTGMDAAALADWWSPVPVEVVTGDSARAALRDQESAWPLWPLLIVLAGALLIAETLYVYRLCPKINPAAVESVVPRRGILKPVGER